MEKIDLAIIIPTLNEEHYIGALLDSIAKQTLQPKEIVVVDAESKDRTIEVIKSYQEILPQLKYYQIPKYTISRQRNLGASKTTSPHILFLDADVELKDPQTLEKYMAEVKKKNPDVAVAHIYPLSMRWKDKVVFTLIKGTYEFTKYFWPIVQGVNLFVTRAIFEKVKGFDRQIKVGEDMEFVQRIIKAKGKFVILKGPKIYTSVRRFEKEGRRKYTLKLVRNFFYMHAKGYKYIPEDYEFGNFKEE